ncbi:MAG TPA: rhodanese-like domain-containing protein [Longimicrobium sp.]|nr:rhodanese-like domain-containing protein [Longimicrobium sp.]
MTRSTPRRSSFRRALLPLLGLALAAAASSPADAQAPRDRLLVTSTWLAAHLNDPDLVLLHVGDPAGYAQAHIPGARLVQMRDVSTPHQDGALMLEMLPAEQLRERLQGLGISSSSRVVVYYGGDWVSPSTRVIFTLAYAGLGDRTSLLDGGMDAWKEAGQRVTADVPPARRGRLAELHPLDLIVDAAWVRGHASAPRVALVDGRAAAFYDGVQATDKRKGHIPGAHSIPFTEITDEHLHVKSAAELATLFRNAGVKPGDTVVGYCHIGQQATAVLFAARTLGYDVRLYDGSFQDWDARTDLPVETRPAGGTR